ncbi:MAG: ATP-binding protein [Haloarculaceae archaeon]
MPLEPSADTPDVPARTVLDRMGDGFFAVDTEWRITYANERGREIIRAAMGDGDTDERVEERNLWEAVPAVVDTVFYERFHEAMATQERVAFEAEYEPLGLWLDVRAFPSETGLSVYFLDITDRKRLRRDRRESLRALQRLYAITADREMAFDAKLEAILDLGCEYLGLPNGFLTRIDHGTQHIEAASASHPELRAGESCPLEEAYCKRTVGMEEPLAVVDAVREGWVDDPAHDRFGLGTYIGGRVTVDGSLYGTLCFADTEPRGEPFDDTRRTFVELLTRWVGYELERQRAEARLTRERDRLDEFASVVSHDLRNPLSVAQGRLDLGREEHDNPHFESAAEALDRMGGLIDDLLALAREGMTIEEPTELSAPEVAEIAWMTVEVADATLAVDPGTGRILGDRSRVRQLFENLFRNAIEHGGPDVTVTVGPLDEGSGFYVADDGPGIPPDERERVLRTGYTTSSEGTGFGLSICSRIAEAHGWELRVVESEDGGTRVELTGVRRPS